MSVPDNVLLFWNAFQATVGLNASARFYEAFHFDDNEQDANSLLPLVLSGQKRATAGLLWVHQATGNPVPFVGALSVVTDWHGAPQCIIETTDVQVVPYEDVTENFAAIEGEGDRSLRHWQDVHWRFFCRECQRICREPNLQMPVVCEQFNVVYPANG